MVEEIRQLLERQARWQKSRKDLTWEEKVEMLERVREDYASWCARPDSPSGSVSSESHSAAKSTPK